MNNVNKFKMEEKTMEEKNIITNEEVVEVAEEFVPASSGNGWKVLGGAVAIAALIYGGRKLWTKIKNKKEQQAEDSVVCDVDAENVEDIA
jgi:hypothetical protein